MKRTKCKLNCPGDEWWPERTFLILVLFFERNCFWLCLALARSFDSPPGCAVCHYKRKLGTFHSVWGAINASASFWLVVVVGIIIRSVLCLWLICMFLHLRSFEWQKEPEPFPEPGDRWIMNMFIIFQLFRGFNHVDHVTRSSVLVVYVLCLSACSVPLFSCLLLPLNPPFLLF